MKTLTKLIEQLKKEKGIRLQAVGTKRSKDITESFDICINIVMDYATQFEVEQKKERVMAYHEGKDDGKNEIREKLNQIILKLEDL